MYDVAIIGAGQQGLALGKYLKDAGKSLVILEADTEIGARWRRHYDSLVLFTPRRFSALPGLTFSGMPSGYATKDEFAAYLSEYAKKMQLPVHTGERVVKLAKVGVTFVVTTHTGSYQAKQVVIASGSTVPVGESANTPFHSLHSSEYKNSSDIVGKTVLVVGNGNSAAQIAVELSQHYDVTIAMREKPRTIPARIFGKDYFWWTSRLGLHTIRVDSFFGKLLARRKDVVVGNDLPRALRAGSITEKPGVKEIAGKAIRFDDESTASFDSVIWATGYRPDYSWLSIPGALDATGMPIQTQGVSVIPGLYFAGMRNQITPVSSNIVGAALVAEFIGERVKRFQHRPG